MITYELGRLVPKIRINEFVIDTCFIFEIKEYFDSELKDVRMHMVGEY